MKLIGFKIFPHNIVHSVLKSTNRINSYIPPNMSNDENKKLISSGSGRPGYGSQESETGSSEDRSQKHIPYPKSVFFIIVNEFCERFYTILNTTIFNAMDYIIRFSFYGMRAILSLYLRNVLKYNEDTTTVIYHSFVMIAYFTPVLGGILADACLGKFRTIFYLSIVYACGNLVLSAAATPPLSLPPIPFSVLGLGLIALGTGGIKSSVIAFGGDQFQIPGQESQLHIYFSIFYLAVNSGSLLSTFITPIFRKDVACFGESTCYPLAFGVPAAFMIVALTIFLLGKPLYKIREPEGNLIVEIAKCIWHALSNLKRKGKSQLQNHWLDCADDEYGAEFIADIKTLLRICLLYTPIPVYFALMEQQGSRWTLQATRMDGRVSGWTIKPDQMQVANSILILVFIPLFDKILYPLFARCNFLKDHLQRITVGGFLVAISFILCGVVELQLEPTYPVLPGNHQTSLNFVNTLPCTVNITLTSTSNYYEPRTVLQNENLVYQAIEANNYTLDVFPENSKCILNGDEMEFETMTLDAHASKAYSILLVAERAEPEIETPGLLFQLIYSEVSDELEKSLEGNAKLRIISSLASENVTFRLKAANEFFDSRIEVNDVASSTKEYAPDIYSVQLSWSNYSTLELGAISLEPGGSYLLSVSRNYTSIFNTTEPLTMIELVDTAKESLTINLYTLTTPNSFHMLWSLPQYVIVTAGEILFAITGYNFSYIKAPNSMKSVVQSMWLMASALGSLIVVVSTSLQLFERQAIEFFAFSGLLFVAVFIFIWLSSNFKAKEKCAQDGLLS